MILSTAAALFYATGSGLVALAIQHSADIYYHRKEFVGPSMWIFNKDGLTVFSPDGVQLRKHRKSLVCPNLRTDLRTGQWTDDCSFFDVQSDGHRYVWAANHDDSPHKIDVFDIDTADYAGYTPTCSTPLDLNYHPARKEMWVRCAAKNEERPGEVDVFSTESICSDHELVNFNISATERAYSRMAAHSTLGTFGFSTQYNQPYITKFDVSGRDVVETFPLEKGYGAYEMTYSPANEHVFAAVRVCCSCGGAGADVEECPYEEPQQVLVSTGPNKRDEPQDGVCSGGCKGTKADTIGVVEFDTVAGEYVAEHNSAANNGCVPISSPDGQHIVLLPFDGGKTVRVLKAGSNGGASSVAADIELDFKEGRPGTQVVSDVAFVQDDSRNLLVIAGSSDNDAVLVDMDDGFRTSKVALTDNVESTSAGNRQVDWAVGTDYVWINGGQTEEMYVLEVRGRDIDGARVVQTIKGVPDGKAIFVRNYARDAETRAVADFIQSFIQSSQAAVLSEEGGSTEATEAPPPPATEAVTKATVDPPTETKEIEAPAGDTGTPEVVSSEEDSSAFNTAAIAMTTTVACLAISVLI